MLKFFNRKNIVKMNNGKKFIMVNYIPMEDIDELYEDIINDKDKVEWILKIHRAILEKYTNIPNAMDFTLDDIYILLPKKYFDCCKNIVDILKDKINIYAINKVVEDTFNNVLGQMFNDRTTSIAMDNIKKDLAELDIDKIKDLTSIFLSANNTVIKK